MRIVKHSIHGSAFIGVFASVTEKIGLFPLTMPHKQVKEFEEALGIEAIQTSIASCSLIGALVKGNSEGFAVPEIIEQQELNHLRNAGIKVEVIDQVSALGNLMAINDHGGIVSPLLSEHSFKQLKKFFSIPLINATIAKTEVVGSSVVATNKGFIANPNIDNPDYKLLKKTFKVLGQPTTANFGDMFIANDILATSNGVIVGSQTSGHEILRIEEGLSGEGKE
ncbi:MAG: translation initiation factor IF-6 [archaeon]|nr:translation initiation factor IF-6 [archaeon]